MTDARGASSRPLSVPRSSVPTMSSAAPTASRWEAQRSFDELGRPLRDVTFCVVDLETTGGSAAGGSMITEIGAVKVRGGRGPRRVPDAGQPALGDPAVHRGAHRHHQLDGQRRPADRVGAARVPRVRRRLRPGGPQRAVRRGLPQALRRRARTTRGPASRSSTRPSWRAGSSPATTRPTASSPRSPSSSTPRRRPTTGPCPTPAPPSTCCTG